MDYSQLPDTLPKPNDDGACSHLVGIKMPKVELRSSYGELVDLSEIGSFVVIYFYPMMGKPGVKLPDGWDNVPGARGCTPQTCGFRDNHSYLKELGVKIFGVSAQDTDYLKESSDRLELPFELVSDSDLLLAKELKLPVFWIEGMCLYKRCTLVLEEGTIKKVFYPVFPPNDNAQHVLSWIKSQGKQL